MILGCDGLWDTIAPPDVIKIVQEHLTKGGARSEVAKLLVQQAIEQGSTDNVTVVIVFLDSHRKEGSYTETKEPAEETNPVPDERDVKCEDTTRDSSASEAQTQVDSMVTNGVLSGTKVPSSISSADSQEKST